MDNTTMQLPDFPEDTRFFVDGDHWRATRPLDSYSGYKADRSWRIYSSGVIEANTMTYEGYCVEKCKELTRDEALTIFDGIFFQRLPEGF